jgi:hypothetical protein
MRPTVHQPAWSNAACYAMTCRFMNIMSSQKACEPLALIQLGKVKVDLANFDVKFRTKLFYVGIF